MTEFARNNNVPAKTDYISREEALEALGEKPMMWHEDDVAEIQECADWDYHYHSIMRVPAADVRPIVRGHWFMISYDEAGCSCCGYDRSTPFESTREAKEKWNELPPFCEMCGADMREEEN